MSNCIFKQAELARGELIELQQSGKLNRKTCSALVRAGSVIRALEHQLKQDRTKEDEKPTAPSKPKMDQARLDAYAQAALTGLLSKGDTSYSMRVQDLAVDMAILTMNAVDTALKEENK